VVRADLRTLERDEQQHEAKLSALRVAIDEGDASGVAEENVFARVRKTLKLHPCQSFSPWPRFASRGVLRTTC
jgi:Arc/MetJ-type ribon-helix-helix transcriptional regulator